MAGFVDMAGFDGWFEDMIEHSSMGDVFFLLANILFEGKD